MEPLKSFEAFIEDAYKAKPIDEEVKFPEKTDSVIPESARKKLWEFVHACMESAVLYESDENGEHTLERFMTEAADIMASHSIKSLKQNKALISIASKAQTFTAPKSIKEKVDPAETKKHVQEYIKTRLDEICNNMEAGFSKGIQNAKEDNHGIAALVASEMMKEST